MTTIQWTSSTSSTRERDGEDARAFLPLIILRSRDFSQRVDEREIQRPASPPPPPPPPRPSPSNQAFPLTVTAHPSRYAIRDDSKASREHRLRGTRRSCVRVVPINEVELIAVFLFLGSNPFLF